MLDNLPIDIQIGKMLIMASIYSETLECNVYQIEIEPNRKCLKRSAKQISNKKFKKMTKKLKNSISFCRTFQTESN